MAAVTTIKNRMAIVVTSLFILFTPMLVPAVVAADDASISSNLCAGASLDVGADDGCADTSFATEKINSIIHSIINLFSLVVGVVSVIMIIVGGLRYIISGGDSNNVSGAKNTIVYAIIGLIIVALAQFMVQFVLSKVTGITN